MAGTIHRRCRSAAGACCLLAAALLALAGCNGDDIGALPEAIAPPGSVTEPPPGSVVLDAVSRGTWRSDGAPAADGSSVVEGVNGCGSTADYNSFFLFDLAGVAGPFSSAELRLEVVNYSGPDPSETLSVWDVTSPIPILTGNVDDINVYNDLQTGTAFGSFALGPPDAGSVVTAPLALAAAAAANGAAGGPFAVGVSLDTIAVGPCALQGAQFSTGPETRTHQLLLYP